MRISDWSSDVCSSDLETITVTGSRIARPELESAMPVGIVSMEAGRKAGNTSAYETILREVAVGPGNGPYNSAPEGQYDGGMATIELRNMGVSRSLTLIDGRRRVRSEEHTSELQSLMRISYAVFCLQKKKEKTTNTTKISP